MNLLQETIQAVKPLDVAAMEKAQSALDYLLKPRGSLGKLEDIARQLAGITGKTRNCVDKKTIIVMAADNGVSAEGVSAFPPDISTLVAETMLRGLSGVAVLARNAGADIRVVDLGLTGDITLPGLINRKIRRSTGSIARGPAMSYNEAVRSVETGIEIANDVIDAGANLLGTGEVGIGNTTTSAAVLYAFAGGDVDIVAGRGTGVDDETFIHKKEIIRMAVEINNPDRNDPIDVLAKVGGFDIGGMAGCFLAAAARRVPVVIDGFISGAAAVLAWKLCPDARFFMFPSHASTEPGIKLISGLLQTDPIMYMNMRLGEGTGCALAFPVIGAAVAMMNEMGTFGDIGMGS